MTINDLIEQLKRYPMDARLIFKASIDTEDGWETIPIYVENVDWGNGYTIEMKFEG